MIEARKRALKINYLSYFCSYPVISNPVNVFTEFKEDFFGIRFIRNSTAPVILQWYDYMHYLKTGYVNNIGSIKIYGSVASFTSGIPGINLSNCNAVLTNTAKCIVVCYEALSANRTLELLLDGITYSIPLSVGFNAIGIRIESTRLVIHSNNNVSYINLSNAVVNDQYDLSIKDVNLYGLNTYDDCNLERECIRIKNNAIKRS